MNERDGSGTDTPYETPYYAHFEHPDGGWYLLWVTHTQPRTARGHPWHVHASFDKHGGIQPVAHSAGWAMAPYGMHNWDFDTEEEALAAFQERYQARVEHGYNVARERLPSQRER